MMSQQRPSINKQFACICDIDHPEMGAIISSYFNNTGTYFALFEFPGVTTHKQAYDVENNTPDTFSLHRADHFELFVNNVLARIKFEGTLILAGLSNEQKSFIRRYPKVTYLEIDTVSEIDFMLSPYFEVEREKLGCKADDILYGLSLSAEQNKILVFDEAADSHTSDLPYQSEGLIVIEDEHKARTLTAVNFANCVKADIMVVKSLGYKAEYLVQNLLSDWDAGDKSALKEIEAMVYERVGEADFSKYKWVTFFTQGLPYSLILQNPIQCSYVSCHYSPDLFIANAILFENNQYQGGAAVFSPLFFHDEETKFVGDYFFARNHYTREIIGKLATVHNLRMHLVEFPYDIFHICSHGGEIKGNLVQEKFTDQFGTENTVEYEQVLSFSLGNKEGYVSVQQLTFPKRLDGKTWGSAELTDHYPSEVFSDMHNAMRISKAEYKTILKKDIIVSYSSHIQCSDSACMPLFETIASHSSPIIFNNTCTSWFNIAMPFLSAGCRAYIGTFCRVKTKDASDFAKGFYLSSQQNTLINALHKARVAVKGRSAENIYMLWGLHFSTLPKLPDRYIVKRHVFLRFAISISKWIRQLQRAGTERVKENIRELIKWDSLQIQSGWTTEEKEQYKKELSEIKSKDDKD